MLAQEAVADAVLEVHAVLQVLVPQLPLVCPSELNLEEALQRQNDHEFGRLLGNGGSRDYFGDGGNRAQFEHARDAARADAVEPGLEVEEAYA